MVYSLYCLHGHGSLVVDGLEFQVRTVAYVAEDCTHETHSVESKGKGIAGVHSDGISAGSVGADIAAEVV